MFGDLDAPFFVTLNHRVERMFEIPSGSAGTDDTPHQPVTVTVPDGDSDLSTNGSGIGGSAGRWRTIQAAVAM